MLPDSLLPLVWPVTSWPARHRPAWLSHKGDNFSSLSVPEQLNKLGFLFCTMWFLSRPDWLALKFHTSDEDATTTVACLFKWSLQHQKTQATPQISCVKTRHQGQAPPILSLWVECSRFDKKLQTPTSPSGRKVWEVWSLLAERVPSPTAQCPASSWTCHHLSAGHAAPRKSQHPVFLAMGREESRRGGRSSPLVVCTTNTPLGSSASLLPSSQPENSAFELAAIQTKMWWLVFCLTSGSISETPVGSGYWKHTAWGRRCIPEHIVIAPTEFQHGTEISACCKLNLLLIYVHLWSC